MGKTIAGVKTVGIKIGRDVYYKDDPQLAKLILHAYDVDINMQDPKKDLSQSKKDIAELAKKYLEDAETVTFIVEGVECKLSFRKQREIPDSNVDQLKDILKGKFEYLVDVKQQFKPTKKLLQMADEDKAIDELIVEKAMAPAVSFKVQDEGGK